MCESANINGFTVYDKYKSFIQCNNMEADIMIHTGKKPYKCDTCGKEWSRSKYPKNTITTHTSETPYKFDTCV